MYAVEVRSRFGVTVNQSEYLMGSPDRGLEGVMGWAAPAKLVERAENLFAHEGFHAGLGALPSYQTLLHAHSVRNRIAHGKGAGTGLKSYLKALTWAHVPARARSGCGPGRLLREYPAAAPFNDKVLHRFLGAYRTYADAAEAALP